MGFLSQAIKDVQLPFQPNRLKRKILGTEDTASNEQLSLLTPAQQEQQNRLLKELGLPARQFEGDMTSGLTGMENMSLDAIENMINTRIESQNDGDSIATERIQELIKSLKPGEKTALEGKGESSIMDILNGGPQDIEEMLTQFTGSARRDLEQNALPQLDRKFANRFFSSERGQAENNLLEDFGNTITDKRAELGFNSRNQAMQDKLAALGLIPGIQQGGLDRNAQLMAALGLEGDMAGNEMNLLVQALQAGGVKRGVEDSRLKGEFDKFQVNAGMESDRVSQMLQLLGIPSVENLTTIKGGKKGLIGPILTAVGAYYGGPAGAKAGAAAGGAMSKSGNLSVQSTKNSKFL